MFLHVVMMAFNDKADAEFFRRVDEYADRIRRECRAVLIYDFGTNQADRSDGLDYAVVAGFESSEAHDQYQISDAHVAMKTYMGPFIDRIVVFDGKVTAGVPA